VSPQSSNGGDPANRASANGSEPHNEDTGNAFERFERLTRELVSVPKVELDRRLARAKRAKRKRATPAR